VVRVILHPALSSRISLFPEFFSPGRPTVRDRESAPSRLRAGLQASSGAPDRQAPFRSASRASTFLPILPLFQASAPVALRPAGPLTPSFPASVLSFPAFGPMACGISGIEAFCQPPSAAFLLNASFSLCLSAYFLTPPALSGLSLRPGLSVIVSSGLQVFRSSGFSLNVVTCPPSAATSRPPFPSPSPSLRQGRDSLLSPERYRCTGILISRSPVFPVSRFSSLLFSRARPDFQNLASLTDFYQPPDPLKEDVKSRPDG
jgi:hypothetical protein